MHVYCWLSNLSIKQHPRIGNCILEFDKFLHHYKQRWLDLRGRQGGPVSEAANIPSSSTCPSRTGVPCMTLLICIPKKTLWIFVYIDCFHRCCSCFPQCLLSVHCTKMQKHQPDLSVPIYTWLSSVLWTITNITNKLGSSTCVLRFFSL